MSLARLLAALGLVAASALPVQALPSYEEVKSAYASSESLLLDRQGQELHRLRTNRSVRRGQWVALVDISPALRQAMVLSEDRRFYEHSGVDWKAVGAAAWGNLFNQRTRGASTLTMQLAGLLQDGTASQGRRSAWGKLGQAISAQGLERHWRKDQILEAYLNCVAYRGEIEGIDALSRTLFDKAPHGLDDTEAAIAAALVRGPNAQPSVVARRACGVLKAGRAEAGCEGMEMRVQAALQRKAWEPSEGEALHVALQLLGAPKPSQGQNQGQAVRTVRSSLSAGLQRQANDLLRQQLRELQGRNVHDGAAVVLDNASGEVLAYVGSVALQGSAEHMDAAAALRQTGSTLKPLLYAQALAEKRITAATLLDDSPAQLATASGLYIPQNYDRQFKGWVSVRTALAASLNVPAVRTITMVSPNAFAQQLRSLGLPLKETGSWYGYSLALGSADLDLLRMTNAYRTLANGGRHSPVNFVPGAQPHFTQALDARAAFIVGDILADRQARARTFGPDSVLNTHFWTAVKTGTSKDMRDNWALGWSQRYTVGVWVGNANGEPMWNVSGTSGAAPVWAALMQFLHRSTASRAPEPPPGVVAVRTRYAQGSEAERLEWFIAGTEQSVIAELGSEGQGSGKNARAESAPAILSPTPGTLIALDPDIPSQNQGLKLHASGRDVRWQIDGKPLAAGNTAYWLPWPGKHKVQLTNAKGQLLDEVRIEVRGAGVVAARAPQHPLPRPAAAPAR